jgi:hypothetical protein
MLIRQFCEKVNELGTCFPLRTHQPNLQELSQHLYSSWAFSLKIHKNLNQQSTFAQVISPFILEVVFSSGVWLPRRHH